MRGRRVVRYRPRESTKKVEYRQADCERLMRCWNEYWEADATWRRKEGIWVCVAASGVIRWMKGMNPVQAKFELDRRGCQWEWGIQSKAVEIGEKR